MAKNRATEILRILKNSFSLQRWTISKKNPFQTLIITILSQATANKNTTRAFENLSKKFSITPKALVEASIEEIEEAIRIGGLYRNKSRVIKAVSYNILEKYNGSLDFIYFLPLEEARKKLISLPGVGPKTADCVLLFCAEKPTIPVDTHVNRVSKRLRLTSPRDGYEEVRRSLETLYSPEDSLSVHLSLIALGRNYCHAKKPRCEPCPVNTLCPSKGVES